MTLAARHADRSDATRYDRVLEVLVDRERARFGAWYEMFPRSAGNDPGRSATFAEAAALLPYIASMRFDVLYLPPIHPIGRSFRKGRNNALTAADGDPGSPWAIGSEAGGHTDVEPSLGTIEDFDRFVNSARRHRLEIALDLAYQASPDHPYVREHPEWFRHRPDGTIKYAENPPKKYQDIYPLNFESRRVAGALARTEADHRVLDFPRRPNLPGRQPAHQAVPLLAMGAVCDSRSASRCRSSCPKRSPGRRSCAISPSAGSRSRTPTSRGATTAAELEEYFTELTETRVREYMRANLFANTPDILHEYLQRGGRPAFQARFVLAATLGASYGIYSGFELVENTPVRTGSEEYLDSEKYQIRIRTFDQPGSLAPLIAQVNGIRRAHPALQRDWGLRFHATDNPELLCYSKLSDDGTDLLVMVVNLDPFHMQHGFVRLPITSWNLKLDGEFEVLDLLSHERYVWRGERNYVRLDPESRVAHILQVRLPAPVLPETGDG